MFLVKQVSGDLKRIKHPFVHLLELQKLECVLLKSKTTVYTDSSSGRMDSPESATSLVGRDAGCYYESIVLYNQRGLLNTVLRNLNTISTPLAVKGGRDLPC